MVPPNPMNGTYWNNDFWNASLTGTPDNTSFKTKAPSKPASANTPSPVAFNAPFDFLAMLPALLNFLIAPGFPSFAALVDSSISLK